MNVTPIPAPENEARASILFTPSVRTAPHGSSTTSSPRSVNASSRGAYKGGLLTAIALHVWAIVATASRDPDEKVSEAKNPAHDALTRFTAL